MTTHAPSSGQSQTALPNQPFFSWLRTHTTLFIGQIIGLLGGISVPIALFYYSHAIPTDVEWETVGHFVIYAHLLFLVVFIAVLIRTLDKNNIGNYRARLVYKKLQGVKTNLDDLEAYSSKQVARFKRRFLCFWISMLCLYLIFAFEPMFSVVPEDCLKLLPIKEMFRTELFPILSFILNNISLILIFSCFSVLYLPTPAARPSHGPWAHFYRLVLCLIQKSSRRRLYKRELRQRTLVTLFALVILVLTLAFPLLMLPKIGVETNWSEYPAAFDALSGTINAIALALLVARLDSKLIGLPSWLICVLYFYAGVQPMFVVFELHPEVYAGIKTAVLLVVFIFKIYFFLIILYSLQTGRIFNYFFCSRVLNAHVKTLRQPLKEESAPQTSSAASAEEKPAKPSSEQPKKEVEPDPSAAPDTERPRASWFKEVALAATGLFARLKRSQPVAPETSPPATVEQTSADHSVDVPAPQSAKRNSQTRPVKHVKEKDRRAIWFLRLGVGASIIFAASLLFYVSLSEKQKQSVDIFPLSKCLIYLHIVTLLAILFVIVVFIFRDRHRENKRGSLLTDKSKFKAAAELRFKLCEPMSPEDRRVKFEELSKRTKNQFKSFTHYFRFFWLSLWFLYVAMVFSPTDDPKRSITCPEKVERTLAPTDGKIAFETKAFSSGSVPEAKTGFFDPNQAERQPAQSPKTAELDKSELSSASQPSERLTVNELPTKVKLSYAFFVINNFTVLVLFWCFSVLYIPNDDKKFDEKHKLLRNYSLLICVLFTVLVPLLAIVIKGNGFTLSEAGKIPTILGAVGGTLNAVAFALLIARLDSRIIGLRLLMVAVLYAYASLQPLFVTFNQPSNLLRFIATSAMIAAFLFKVCLVFMVGHIRNSGGLIHYLWFFPVISHSVNSVFGNQFEIKTSSPKPGSFTFSIFNRSVETYRAAEMYTSRAQCDDVIKMLVAAMKIRENYGPEPKELQGTYWIQVKSDGRLLCESISLRSQSEATELINESIEKVPYCKFDRG